MSWLAKPIKKVLREKKNQSAELEAMMEIVQHLYEERWKNGELRVHDKKGEGFLYGVRKNVTLNAQTNTMEISCSRKMFLRQKEEAFSRGLFNQKRLSLGGHNALLVSYEAPLLRKTSGRGGGICKLDLVALEESAIWAIEYKQSYGQATSIRYGILESLAYGFLLACHLRDNKEGLRKQVAKCIDSRGPYPGLPPELPDTVKFSVAAPSALYREDVRTPRRLHLTDMVTKIACGYASAASERLNLNLSFGGFLVIGDDQKDLACKSVLSSDTEVITYFKSLITEVPVYDDIEQVRANVEKP